MSNPPRWPEQGCDVCRGQWERGQRPRHLAENVSDRSSLFRCDVCGTLWLLTERYAAATAADAIRATYGEYLND